MHQHDAALGLQQGGNIAVHMVEGWQAQVALAQHGFQAAAGIGNAVVEQQVTKTVRHLGGEALDPVIPAVDAVAYDAPHLLILAVGGNQGIQHAGNIGRIVLAIGIQHHQPFATGFPGTADDGDALADAAGMADHLKLLESLLLQGLQGGKGGICAAIVYIDEFVVVTACHGVTDLADQRADVVSLVLGGYDDGYGQRGAGYVHEVLGRQGRNGAGKNASALCLKRVGSVN